MERRNFLRMASAAGLAVTCPFAALGHPGPNKQRLPLRIPAPRTLAPYDGPLYAFFSAIGGLDQVFLCDPKGAESLSDPNRPSNYLETDILSAGNIRYAPIEGNQAFFDKHYSRLLILNGIDTQTNNHDAGIRAINSGRLSEGNPALPALISAVHAPTHPISYMTFGGGYDRTMGIIGKTTIGARRALPELATPERESPGCDACETFLPDNALDAIKSARLERQSMLESQKALPRTKAAMASLFSARVGAEELRRIQPFLPDSPDQSGNPLRAQVELVLAAYRAGLCISAVLPLSTFDTHDNHDSRHPPLLRNYLDGIDFMWSEAERFGIADKLVIVAGTDFGRTPFYNRGAGKDHWSVGSMMMMGQGIPGNKVIGATDDKLNAFELDPVTLEAVPRGEPLRPAHIHRSLRKLAKVDTHELSEFFPLEGTDLPLLG